MNVREPSVSLYAQWVKLPVRAGLMGRERLSHVISRDVTQLPKISLAVVTTNFIE